MSKLYEIKGYWSPVGVFNDKDMWEGKLLLEDNGWFEGIVVDPYSPYTKDRLIFGCYHPDKVMELVKVTPEEVSDPFVFRASKGEDGYDGSLALIGFVNEIFCGACHIITKEVEKDIEKETEELSKKIDDFKAQGHFKELYENTYAIRNERSTILLKNYIGEELSDEEKRLIDEAVEENNKRVEGEMLFGFDKLFIDDDDEYEDDDFYGFSK